MAALVGILLSAYGTIGDATSTILERDASSGTRYAAPPSSNQYREWLSYILVLGVGTSLYPHANHRVFAAKNTKVL